MWTIKFKISFKNQGKKGNPGLAYDMNLCRMTI